MDDKQKKVLASLPSSTLIGFIVDIHGIDNIIDKKIERLLLQADKPKLIKKLTTTIKGLKRRRKFIDYWGSTEFAMELEHLKSDVMSLQQTHPQECLTLIELFMETANNSIERCDDSNGEVGDVYISLSACWLAVATTCYQHEKHKAPADEMDFLSQFWQDRVTKIMEDNDYDFKYGILLNINQLLDNREIKLLIEDYEQKYDDLVAKANKAKSQQAKTSAKTSSHIKNPYFSHFFDIDFEHEQKYDFKIRKLASNLESLAYALGDVAIFERFYFKHRPKRPLNPRQLENLLSFMIQHDAFELALGYLDNEWQSNSEKDEVERLDWFAKIYGKQGDIQKQQQALGEAFEIQSTTQRLKDILTISTPAQQAKWRKKALQLAQNQDNVIRAVELLLEIGEVDLANDMAVTRASEFEGVHYYKLTDLLEILPENTELIQIICYRSLVNDILNSSRSKAYHIAARYFQNLYQLDASMYKRGLSYQGMKSHKAYIEMLREKHGKKRSFWEKVAD